MSWKMTAYGWRHAPWWKRAINTILRTLQPGLRRKLVLYTNCIEQEDGPPLVTGYGFGLITHANPPIPD